MSIHHMTASNLFADIPDHLPDEVFQDLITTDAVRIERIISKGHTTPDPDWYDQEQNEWVLVVKGEAVLLFEEGMQRVTLSEGIHINIPAHVRHKVEWTHPDKETVWLAVFY